MNYLSSGILRERECGMSILVSSLLEFKIPENEIMQSVMKYYYLPFDEAERLIFHVKTVEIPCHELETYIMNKKLVTRDVAQQIILDSDIADLLEKNSEYSKLSLDELYEMMSVQ